MKTFEVAFTVVFSDYEQSGTSSIPFDVAHSAILHSVKEAQQNMQYEIYNCLVPGRYPSPQVFLLSIKPIPNP